MARRTEFRRAIDGVRGKGDDGYLVLQVKLAGSIQDLENQLSVMRAT